MPRKARSRSHERALEPGAIYHVTNRGVERRDIFQSDLDRLLFLSMVADACLETGVLCHCFCLLDNHFHLVVEDVRGTLSQFMHAFEGPYARYFNDTRERKRKGPLFEGRFHSDLIDSRRYFENACAYVLHNPLRTSPKLAQRPEKYAWSSAAFTLSPEGATAEAFCLGLVGRLGGVEAMLERMPRAARKRSRELRRRRLEALASGGWLERRSLLAERSPEQYAAELASRRGEPSPFRSSGEEGEGEAEAPEAAGARALPRRATAFEGVALEQAFETIAEVSARLAPGHAEQLAAYLAHRFTPAAHDRIGAQLGVACARVSETVERVRRLRAMSGWSGLLWRMEWALRWALLAAPCRP